MAIDPLRRNPGYLLQRASIAASAALSLELSHVALRRVEASLLLVIEANPGLKQSDACRLLAVQRANMTPMVAALEDRGLLRRTPIDGRSQGISLTPKGRTLARRARSVVDRFEQTLIEAVPPSLRAHVEPILLAIWDGLQH